MNEYLKVFDTIRFYTPRSIFENFVRFFIFWIQIQILNLDWLGTGRNRNRSGLVGPVPTGSVNPAAGSRMREARPRGRRRGWGPWLSGSAKVPERLDLQLRQQTHAVLHQTVYVVSWADPTASGLTSDVDPLPVRRISEDPLRKDNGASSRMKNLKDRQEDRRVL
jgi:hypothetical protein